MGMSPHITASQFPDQSPCLGQRVEVCFHYHADQCFPGVMVRDDVGPPFVAIIKLDDGRHVLATECQYRFAP